MVGFESFNSIEDAMKSFMTVRKMIQNVYIKTDAIVMYYDEHTTILVFEYVNFNQASLRLVA